MRTEGGGLSRARTILLTVLGVEVAVLVVTGIALFFVYRPSVGQAWNVVYTGDYDWGTRLAHGVRLVHRFASWLAVPTAIATGVVVAVDARDTVRGWRGPVVGAGIAVTTLAASFTGFLLPWDQLAIRAVTVGTNIRGFRELFGDEVAFVLIGGTEISTGTIVRWLLVRMLLLGPLLVGLVLFAWRRPARAGRGQKESENISESIA